MHKFASRFNIKYFAGCANVAFIVAVDSKLLIEQGDKHKITYIELTVVIKQRIQIALKNNAAKSFFSLRRVSLFALFEVEPLFQFLQGFALAMSNYDSSPSI